MAACHCAPVNHVFKYSLSLLHFCYVVAKDSMKRRCSLGSSIESVLDWILPVQNRHRSIRPWRQCFAFWCWSLLTGSCLTRSQRFSRICENWLPTVSRRHCVFVCENLCWAVSSRCVSRIQRSTGTVSTIWRNGGMLAPKALCRPYSLIHRH